MTALPAMAAVSFGIERRGSSRPTSPRRTLGSLLVDRMASFRAGGSSAASSSQDDPLDEDRRCFSERSFLLLLLLLLLSSRATLCLHQTLAV